MSFKMAEMGKVSLPSGFTLVEDGIFFRLSFGNAVVSNFSSFGVTPWELKANIEKTAMNHLGACQN